MAKSSSAQPPSASAIFVVYVALGAVLSYAFGRDPSTGALLPDTSTDEFAHEVAPTIIVICLFLTSYSLLDVMTVGILKEKHRLTSKAYPYAASLPEEVYLAQRVQTNQVEQLPGFLIGSLCFTTLVNGRVGAVLSLMWAVLRRMYASAYRSSMGKTVDEAGIAKFTIPAYFALNSMLMGTVVQCVRVLL